MQFENKITIGNLLTIAFAVGSVIYTYGTLKGEQDRLADKVAAVEAFSHERASIGDARSISTDTRLRAVENGQAGMSADVRNILSAVTEIKQQLAQEAKE